MTLPNCPVTARLGGTAGAAVAAASPRRARGKAVASLADTMKVPILRRERLVSEFLGGEKLKRESHMLFTWKKKTVSVCLVVFCCFFVFFLVRFLKKQHLIFETLRWLEHGCLSWMASKCIHDSGPRLNIEHGATHSGPCQSSNGA